MLELERFWSKVDKRAHNECWRWLGSVEKTGNPVFYLYGGKKMRAHRYALQLKLRRPLVDGAFACHHCDVPDCVNPQHIYEGTSATNNADKMERARQMRGSMYKTNLTEHDVARIIEMYRSGEATQRAIAEAYGIHQSEVSRMVNGKAWKHVRQAIDYITTVKAA